MACALRLSMGPGLWVVWSVIPRTDLMDSLGTWPAPKLSVGTPCLPGLHHSVPGGRRTPGPECVLCSMEGFGYITALNLSTKWWPKCLQRWAQSQNFCLRPPQLCPASPFPLPLSSLLWPCGLISHEPHALQPSARNHLVPCPSSLAHLPRPLGLISGVSSLRPPLAPAQDQHPAITVMHYRWVSVVFEQVATQLG